MNKLYEIIKFPEFGDNRGSLTTIEFNSGILPFKTQRIYYIHNTRVGVSRGFHAHKKLQQVIIAVSGSFELHLLGRNSKEIIYLSDPSEGILISSFIWREMHNLSDDCVILVLASEPYTESDYIREFSEYLEHLEARTC